MLVKEPVEYPELPDEDEASNEALLHEPESNKCALPSAPPPQKVVLFCPLPGQVRHLKWWLTMFFADHLDILYMYAEMGNDERTEMQLKFQDSPNPSVFVTTPKVGGTGLNLTAANHAVMTQKFWVLNVQRQAFAWVVRLGQNKVAHTWLLNTGPNGISKKHFRPGGMAPSEWTRSVRAVRDTPVADYSVPGANMTRCVAYRSPIPVSPLLLALSVSCCK